MDDALETRVTLQLLETAAYLERRLDRALSGVKGISFREYRLLAALHDAPDSSATRVALASAVGVTPSGATRALKPLEKLGYVTTARGERDARQAIATLTPAGRDLVADAKGVVDDMAATLLRARTEPADQERTLNFLEAAAWGSTPR